MKNTKKSICREKEERSWTPKIGANVMWKEQCRERERPREEKSEKEKYREI